MANKKAKVKKKEDVNRDKPKYPQQVLTLTLPIPPSVNAIYYNTNRGKILTKHAQQWKAGVNRITKIVCENQGWKQERKHVWFYCDMVYYMPDRRVRDTHNTFKLLFDSIEGPVFENDYHIMPRVNNVFLDKKNPRLECVIYAQPYDVEEIEYYEEPDDITVIRGTGRKSKPKSSNK